MEHLLRLFKRDWPYFAGLTAFFILSIVMGQQLPDLAPEFALQLERQVMNHFAEIAKQLRNTHVYSQIMLIWLNNIFASFLAILGGALLIPLLPLFFLAGNGLIIGLVQRMTVGQGMNGFQFYLALLPHGILEIPAFLIAVYLGLRFSLIPYRLLWYYVKMRQYRSFLKEFFMDFPYYALTSLILLLVAAVIEMTISPLLLG